MAKKIVAKTRISYGKKDGEQVDFEPGDEVNASELGMTKAQLEQLYDAGAIELEETANAREEDKEDAEPPVTEEPVSPPAAPVKSTPTKATASEAKSGGKGNAA